MNRGSLPVGKILLIAAVVIALLIFARPFLSGMGQDKEATTTQENTVVVAPEATAPVESTEAAPAVTAPNDSTAPASDANQESSMVPAVTPGQEPTSTTVPSAN